MIDQPLWVECGDPDVRAAAAEVWQRLPIDARRRLAAVKLYAVRDLKASDGSRVLGLARPGEVRISTTGHTTQRVLVETVAHEFLHHLCGHVSANAQAIKTELQREREVIAQLRALGFGDEVDHTARYWGADPRLRGL